MEIIEFGRLTRALRAQLEGVEQDPFDAASSTLRYRPKEQHVALQDTEGRVVACTGMLVVDVDASARRFPVVGLGGVIVNADYRGRGLARQVVEAALVRARTLGPEFAMLFCLESRAGLYGKLGFSLVDAEVVVQQPDGEAVMPLLTMWRSLQTGSDWPAGRLVLNSLPF